MICFSITLTCKIESPHFLKSRWKFIQKHVGAAKAYGWFPRVPQHSREDAELMHQGASMLPCGFHYVEWWKLKTGFYLKHRVQVHRAFIVWLRCLSGWSCETTNYFQVQLGEIKVGSHASKTTRRECAGENKEPIFVASASEEPLSICESISDEIN